MNKQLQVFKNEKSNQKLRTILNDDGTINYSLDDVARAVKGKYIQYKNGKEYVRLSNINNDLGKFGFPTLNGKDEFISESAVYLLIMNGENELAVEFQKWLAVEVIPSIRKHGAYSTSNQNSINEFKGQVATLINDMFEEKLKDVKEYYKIKSKSKTEISSYIKKRLGILRADDEYEQVKARLFLLLGISKWEDLNVDNYKTIIPLIDESIRVVKLERPYEQVRFRV